jgi:adenosylcobinamide-GDP ribazoletransferase
VKIFKQILKSIDVAFSMYSKIPMPGFTWNSDDMKYHLIFFPLVGAVIGLLEWVWLRVCLAAGIGNTAATAVALAVPLLVTGGIHVDGFMDTMDAVHSWQDREKKLEILKDPHIGAFAVISLAAYGLLAFAAMSQILRVAVSRQISSGSASLFASFCCVFFLSRSLSGISVSTFRMAKKDGMLKTSEQTAAKRAVWKCLLAEAAVCVILMVRLCPVGGGLMALAVGLAFVWYRHMSYRTFGGITGDLAGWFVTVAELMAMIAGWIAGIL